MLQNELNHLKEVQIIALNQRKQGYQNEPLTLGDKLTIEERKVLTSVVPDNKLNVLESSIGNNGRLVDEMKDQ